MFKLKGREFESPGHTLVIAEFVIAENASGRGLQNVIEFRSETPDVGFQ